MGFWDKHIEKKKHELFHNFTKSGLSPHEFVAKIKKEYLIKSYKEARAFKWIHWVLLVIHSCFGLFIDAPNFKGDSVINLLFMGVFRILAIIMELVLVLYFRRQQLRKLAEMI